MTPNQITDTTYQLHNFINPFDRQDSYILLSGGYSKTLVIDKNRHSPTRYWGIKNWEQLKSIWPGFTPFDDAYLMPFSPLSESRFRNKPIADEFVEYQNIYRYFEEKSIRQQPKATLICLCMLLAKNYDEKLGGIPMGIKMLATRLGTNSRKITVSIKSLEEMGLIVFHQRRADIDKVTLPCFIEPTSTFVLKFTSLFRKGKTIPKEEPEAGTPKIQTAPEQDYDNFIKSIAAQESIYDDTEENLTAKKPDYYLHGKEGFFWYQNKIYTLKVRLLNLVRKPKVEEVVKAHAYRALL